MVIDTLATRYPELYHMADKRNWDNIRKYGLLSTTALLDLFEYEGNERFEIESQLRVKEFPISHATHGKAVIRDQAPMRDRPWDGIRLENCLDGITPQEWFEFLNRRTFFWTEKEGLRRMLGAVLYRNESHYVMIVDTRKLISRYSSRVTLSSINSGSLYGQNARIRRSTDTFKPMSIFPRMKKIWELAVEYKVPDVLDLTSSAHECISYWDKKKGARSIKAIRRIYPP